MGSVPNLPTRRPGTRRTSTAHPANCSRWISPGSPKVSSGIHHNPFLFRLQ